MSTTPDTPTVAELQDAIAARDAEIADLQRELEHWRTKAITGWSAQVDDGAGRSTGARSELVAGRESVSWHVNLSWRLNVPLQVARRVSAALRGGVRKVTGR